MIDGSKQFITNATTAGLFVVFARTAPATDTSPGVAVFLVPADAPVLHVRGFTYKGTVEVRSRPPGD